MDKQYVWILRGGLYEQEDVLGVYANPEEGMKNTKGTWTKYDDEHWSNDLDWEESRRLDRFEVLHGG